MAWCPLCKSEYIDTIETCKTCNIPLQQMPVHIEEDGEGEKWSFLLNVSDEREVKIIEGLLLSEEIPLLKKYREAGDYLNIYMGISIYGIDLYVPEEYLDKSKEILNSRPEEISDEEIGPELEDGEDV